MNKPLRFFVILSLIFNLIMLTSCDDSSVSVRFIVSGNEYALLSADSASDIKLPPDPEMDGYTFSGWYLGEEEGSRVFTLDSLIAGETVTVYAKWTEIHVHVESEVRIFKEPTCTSDGIAFTECVTCGYKMSTAFIEQLPHDASEWLTDVHPICTEEGAAHKECLVCATVTESKVLPALSHDERTLEGEAPTETRDGITEGKDCLRCGEVLIAQERLPAMITGTELVIDGFEKNGTDLSATLGSGSDTLSLFGSIKINEASSLVLSRNADGTDVIDTPTLPLSFGDNTFYIAVTSGEDTAVYTVTVYRKRAFTVTFNTRGSAVEPITVDEGEVIKTVPVSNLAGYDFLGWDVDLTLPVTGSVCASAMHSPRKDTPYTVVYYTREGTDYAETYREMCVGETDTLSIIPTYQPERYMINRDKSDVPALIKGDGSLTLSVYLDHIKYTVSFNTGTGVPIPSETVLALEPYSPPTPERAGYRFDGWLCGGKAFESVDRMTSDLELVASWVRLATVTFDTSSIAGFTVEPVTVDVGARVNISLEYPSTRELTVGFFHNGSPWIVGYSIVTEDITVVAEWVAKSVTVTFESKGAEPPAPITVDYGSVIESVETPYRGNTYSFEGWYIKGSDIRWIPGTTPVTSDLTLEAHWSIMTPPDVWG